MFRSDLDLAYSGLGVNLVLLALALWRGRCVLEETHTEEPALQPFQQSSLSSLCLRQTSVGEAGWRLSSCLSTDGGRGRHRFFMCLYRRREEDLR